MTNSKTTAQHTPGPWKRDKYGSVIGPDGKDILFRGVSVLSAGSDERMAMAEANTDLAAAAPALLEALRGIRQMSLDAKKGPAHAAKLTLSMMADVADDAIAKASA